jgi:hypothetical protein
MSEITFICGSFPDIISQKKNLIIVALHNVCAPTILLASSVCCYWLGILFSLTTGKTDRDSPAQFGRVSHKGKKNVFNVIVIIIIIIIIIKKKLPSIPGPCIGAIIFLESPV